MVPHMNWLSCKKPGYLPFTYIESLLATLQASPHVRFRSFADLPFNVNPTLNSEDDMRAFYKAEYASWKKEVEDQNNPVIDIILMHDCDSGPEQTVHMCEYEAAHSITSTTSLFTRTLVKGALTPYCIDDERLLAAQEKGICFSYHCNAYQTANYDEVIMNKYFNEDVEELTRRGFVINCFSPHGGPACPNGLNNNAFFYPSFSQRHLVWTHNRFGPAGKKYSDGSLAPRLAKGDPTVNLQHALFKTIALNNRVFILLHPQYYFSETPGRSKEIFEASPWVKEFWQWHDKGQPEKYWEPLLDFIPKVRPRGLWYTFRHKMWQGYNFLKSRY